MIWYCDESRRIGKDYLREYWERYARFLWVEVRVIDVGVNWKVYRIVRIKDYYLLKIIILMLIFWWTDDIFYILIYFILIFLNLEVCRVFNLKENKMCSYFYAFRMFLIKLTNLSSSGIDGNEINFFNVQYFYFYLLIFNLNKVI